MNYTAIAIFIGSPPYRPKRLWTLLAICSAFMFAYIGTAAVYVVQLSFPGILR